MLYDSWNVRDASTHVLQGAHIAPVMHPQDVCHAAALRAFLPLKLMETRAAQNAFCCRQAPTLGQNMKQLRRMNARQTPPGCLVDAKLLNVSCMTPYASYMSQR